MSDTGKTTVNKSEMVPLISINGRQMGGGGEAQIKSNWLAEETTRRSIWQKMRLEKDGINQCL